MSREVLSPPLQRMGTNRCYRVNLVHDDFGGHPAKQQPGQAAAMSTSSKQGYTEQDLYAEDDEDDDENAFTVEELPNSMFKLTMHVAQSFYGGLIGFKGNTKRRIEGETQTDIHVPRGRETGGSKTEDVTIKGKTRSSVCTARRKIQLLVGSLRKRMRPTHFFSVALNSGEVMENFIEFKKAVLAAQFPGINEQLFQIEGCVHLTLSTCVLLDDAERAKAVALLQDCKQFVADLKTPFEIKVSGLEIMNDDPSAVRILYASIVAPDLQKFANRVLRKFLDSGLGNEERDSVKLHMTLLSNRYRKQLNAESAESFDAREILKRFGDFHFGTAFCNEVQLCVMGSKTEARGEFYKISGALKF